MAGKWMRPPLARLLAGWLILLSVTACVESLQCYWCGPLAEQVHRSQRAPSCGSPEDQVTACDPGYSHCAVVATSPPLVESRYCVKFYQDECYTLYCNSTKTYRMTCPCRGELCNGVNSEREIKAFEALSKAVGKTTKNRIKKRNALISNKPLNKHKIISNIQTDMDVNIHVNSNFTNEPNLEQVKNDVENEISDTIKVDNFDNKSKDAAVMQSDLPSGGTKTNNDNSISFPNTEHTTSSENESTVSTVLQVTVAPSQETTTMKGVETTTVMTQTMKAEDFYVSNDLQSMQLPTAEALQHNAGNMVTGEKTAEITQPNLSLTITTDKATTQTLATSQNMMTTEKSTETTAFSTLTTKSTSEMHPNPTKSMRNNAVAVSFSFSLCSYLLNYLFITIL